MAVSQNPPSKPNTNTQNEEQEMESIKPDFPQQSPILPSSSSPSKNTQSSEVDKGKYCHQCRQRKTKFKSCKNQRNKKPCTIRFCTKCLFNRYGEKAEDVSLFDDWKCPKCRDICNCSCCMKRKGSQPIGSLVHTAKASGFSSVSEMLIVTGPEDLISLMAAKDVSASQKNPSASSKELVVAELMSSPLEKTDLPMQISDKIYPDLINKEEGIDEENNSLMPACDDEVPEAHIPLPQGIDLTTVVGIDLRAEDVGYALQFLEFCKAFGQVFNLKEGLPESVIQELTCGRLSCRGQNSSIVQFHFQLLSLMQKGSGVEHLLSPSNENSWLQALGKCLSESQWELEDFSLKCFDEGVDGYDKLDLSTKLRLLNFLCDEALSTPEIRSWIERQNSEFVERKKEVKGKLVATKDKERSLKQKMKDEIANAVLKNGAPLSIVEHDKLISNMKIEVAEAHAEMLEVKSMATKNKARSDAVRTESILLDGNGHAFWRLESYSDEPYILLQDIGSWDSVTPQDKWFTYDSEQCKAVEDYISFKRNKKPKI